MNLRALLLLFAFLLMQVGAVIGQAVCQPGKDGAACGITSAVPTKSMTCATGCCEVMEADALLSAGHQCACLQSSPQHQQDAPQNTTIPAPAGRDLVPQVSLSYLSLFEELLTLPGVEVSNSTLDVHDDILSTHVVPIRVLHCAFLI